MAETATPASNANARTPNTTLYVLVGLLVTEIAMVACAFIWVFIYSTVIDTTGNEAYAQDASPVVAVVVAFPIFFVMGRVFCRLGARATMAALIAVGINLAIDFPLVLTMAEDLPYALIASVLAASGKISGAYVGTRPARATSP